MVTRPFPVNPILTALAISYRNPASYMIADQVLPPQPVPGERFSWMSYPIGTFFTVPHTEVGRRGRTNRVEFTGALVDDAVRDFGLEDSVPITDIDAAAAMRRAGQGTFDPMNTATEGLVNLIDIDRENRVAAVVQNPANYAPSRRLALAGSDQFSDPTSDPIGVIKAAMAATLIMRPNTAVMGRAAWDGLSSHPKLVNAVKGNVTGSGIIQPDEFARLFGLKQVLLGEGFLNTARPVQAVNMSRIWGKSIELLFIDPAARPESGMSWGMTATFGDRFAGDWFDKDVGIQGGQVIRVGERKKELVTAPDVGFIIQNVVA